MGFSALGVPERRANAANEATAGMYLDFYKGNYDIAQHALAKEHNFYEENEVCKLGNIIKWDHELMETRHEYVQWLFPILTRSRTRNSIDPVTPQEVDTMNSTPIVRTNVLCTYKWFLRFMGAEMVDETTGELRTGKWYGARRANIVANPHNYQRITRLLSWLHLMQREEYVLPLWIFAVFHYPDTAGNHRYWTERMTFCADHRKWSNAHTKYKNKASEEEMLNEYVRPKAAATTGARVMFGRVEFEPAKAGGFSFGGASSGTPSAKAASGGFSFGDVSSGTPSAKAASGGFSFGSASSGTSSAEAASGVLGHVPSPGPLPLPGSFCMYRPMVFGKAQQSPTKVRVLRNTIEGGGIFYHKLECLDVITNATLSAYSDHLHQIPDDELTPLEMSFRQPFRPSAVLRAQGIEEAAVMDVVELRSKLKPATIMLPEYPKCEDHGRWGPTWSEYFNENLGGVDKGLLNEKGWVDGDIIAGLLLRMASQFGAVTFESTKEEVQRHFQKCKQTNRETFLLLDGQQWLRGGALLSPRRSPFRDRINDIIVPSRGSPAIDMTADSPPERDTGTKAPEPDKDPKAPVLDRVVPDETSKVPITGRIFQLMDVSAFDNILMPIETGGHWILGRIRPNDHTTRIYDSLGYDRPRWLGCVNKFRDDTWQNKWLLKDILISPVTGELLSNVEKANFEEMYEHEWVDDDNFNKSNSFPKQNDSSACGVFVMTYIAYMLTGHEDKIRTDVTQVNTEKVFRPWLARMVCEEAVPAAP